MEAEELLYNRENEMEEEKEEMKRMQRRWKRRPEKRERIWEDGVIAKSIEGEEALMEG